MMQAILTGVETVISCAGSVATAIFGEAGELKDLLPAVGLAIGVGLGGVGIGWVKSLTWGF